jgi:polyisoprenoid-binding protein YceI
MSPHQTPARPGRRLAASVLLATIALAAPARAFSTDPSGVPKASYKLDAHHTSVVMRVSHMGFSHYTLRFDDISGALEYDPDDRRHPKLTVDIDPKSVDSGAKGLDGQIAGPGFFDAARFPKITFVGRELTETGDGRGELTGDLSFHGVTRPVRLQVAFNGWGGDVIGRTTLGFSARGEIARSDFGVKAYEGLVGDVVDLTIEAEFLKDGLLTRLLP